MTLKEILQMDCPSLEIPEDCIGIGCPYHNKYEKERYCDKNTRDCKVCWNREMPNTETRPKEDMDREDYMNLGYNKGLNDGRNEVWEFMKKWDKMTCEQSMDIFGTSALRVVLEKHTPQEALAKLKAYEEANVFTMGDEVICLEADEKAIFFWKSEGSQIGWFLLKEYDVPQQIMMNEVKKTGKHLNIQSILEQIGE